MTMIERVARAMYEARAGGGNWDVLAKQRNSKYERAKWRKMARAAIAAVREPSEVMAAAVERANIETGGGAMVTAGDSHEVWRAMIDAVLREGGGHD